MDQGIIQYLKLYYRRQLLLFIIETFDRGENLIDLMNIHLVFRWILRAWNNLVSSTIIYNCFRKSTLIDNSITLPTIINPPDINQIYERVTKARNIHDIIAISTFLNPVEETLIDKVIQLN